MTNHYCMVIDTTRCVGCHSCSVACKMENNLPDTAWWTRALTVGGDNMDSPAGVWPNLKKSYLTLSCQHCENPACIKVCPVSATYKDEETGIVLQDYDRCIGCRYCMSACPYSGVRVFNWEEPTYLVDFPIGAAEVAPHQRNVVEKCTFCAHRLKRGELPACVEGCPAKARFFGDLNDPDSVVSKKLRERTSFQLLLEKETNPSIYYLT